MGGLLLDLALVAPILGDPLEFAPLVRRNLGAAVHLPGELDPLAIALVTTELAGRMRIDVEDRPGIARIATIAGSMVPVQLAIGDDGLIHIDILVTHRNKELIDYIAVCRSRSTRHHVVPMPKP